MSTKGDVQRMTQGYEISGSIRISIGGGNGIPVPALLVRKLGLQPWRLADSITPALAMGIFDAPLPVHPTQIYEAIAAFLGRFLAIWLLRQRLADGKVFLVFVLWFTTCRWVNHNFLFIPVTTASPGWLYPTIYAVVKVCCLGALLRIGQSEIPVNRTE